jgi:signal transduction histidine kinase
MSSTDEKIPPAKPASLISRIGQASGSTTLQQRLSVGLALSLLLLLAGEWLIADRLAYSTVERYAIARIGHDIESLLAAVELAPDGAVRLDSPQINAVYQRPLSGHYYQIATADQLLRSRSLWDRQLPLQRLAPGESLTFDAEWPVGQRLLIVSRGFSKQQQQLTITVAEDLSPLDQPLASQRIILALLALAVVVALILIQRRVVQSGLEPLEAARRQIVELGSGTIERLDSTAVPPEVRPLVDEINRLLLVMARRLERSRHSLGNLTHALKGPLTLMMQLAAEAPSPLREELLEQGERLRWLMERELKRARLAGSGAPVIAIRAAVEPLLETVRRLHAERNLEIGWHAMAVDQFAIDREDLLELLGNLLDNGCKWANSRIVLTLSGSRSGDRPESPVDTLLIVVEDDGPGVEESLLPTLTGRGRRLDECREGHGLGLAIVADLVRDRGGWLHFDRSPLGGLRVSLSLPATEGGESRSGNGS